MSECLTELLPDLGRLEEHWAGLRVAWGPHIHNFQWMKVLDMGMTLNFSLAKTCTRNTHAVKCPSYPSEGGRKRKQVTSVGSGRGGGCMRYFTIVWEGSKSELACASPPCFLWQTLSKVTALC